MYNEKQLLAVTEAGATKYFEEQMMLLQQFSGIDCPTYHVEGIQKVVDILKGVMSQMDVSIEEYFDPEYGTHLLARIKPENPDGKIIISAHTDTFSGFCVGDVEKHPYHIDGDWAYGLGIVDCKGGIVSSLYAVRIMQEANLLPNKEIVMIYSADEEEGSISSRKIFKKEAEGAQAAYVFEPSRDDNGVLTSRDGIAVVELQITGVPAHPGTAYYDGRSAAKELAYQTIRAFDATDKDNVRYDVEHMFSNAGISDVASAYLVGIIKSTDGYGMYRKLLAEINESKPFVDGCSVKAIEKVAHTAMPRTDANVELYNKAKAAAALMGIDCPEQPSQGCGDACLFSKYGVACIDGLGPYMRDIHTDDERMYIPSLPEKTKLFALMLGMM